MDESSSQPAARAIPQGATWVRVNRFFGDAMMAYAALEPLRRAGLPLVYWGPAPIVDLFAGSAHVVATVAEPARNYGVWQAARMLRDHRPAAVIGFPKSARPHLASLLAQVPLRLGCGDGGVRLLLTHGVAFYQRDDHFVERYASVVTRAFPGLGPMAFTPFRPREEAFTLRAFQAGEAGLSGDYAVLAPGANSGSKRLSIPLFAALGRRLEAQGLKVVILGAGAEDERLAGCSRCSCPVPSTWWAAAASRFPPPGSAGPGPWWAWTRASPTSPRGRGFPPWQCSGPRGPGIPGPGVHGRGCSARRPSPVWSAWPLNVPCRTTRA